MRALTIMEMAMRDQVLRSGAVEIRPGEFLALVRDRPLALTARELDLLTALVLRAGRIVSREELYRAVWGDDYRKSDRSVDVYVGKLRQKLEEALPGVRFIHTHFGFGYRFQQQEAPRRALESVAPSHRFHIPETSP
jgi:DNA-binding response OmpR family regulator